MNKKRIILTSIVGIAAIATLSVSLTWAWYSSSDRLKINSFDIDMNGDAQLLMSTSKELDTFKQELTSEDLIENEFLFAPVSSMYRDAWMSQKADTPVFYDCSSPVAEDGIAFDEEAAGGFFQKRIYLLSNIVDYYATLDVEACAFEYNEKFNSLRAQELHKEYPEVSVDDITQKLNSLRDCLRMSILVNEEDYYRYYVIDPYKQENEEVLFGGLLDNNADGYYDTYNDGGSRREYIYGQVNDRSKAAYVDPVDPTAEIEKIDTKGNFYGNSFDAKNRKDAYTFDIANSQGLEIAKEESYALDEIGGLDTEVLIPCYRGRPTEIVISIYLEGWDKACINETMGACFDTNISFKLLRRIL